MPLLSFLLLGLSHGYGLGLRIHRFAYQRKNRQPRSLPAPVISIGNLTVGGTGKTPMTRYIASRLLSIGRRPAVLSRGYGGSAQREGGVAGDGERVLMSPETAGDEPCLLARQLKGVPVLVGKDRYLSGMMAVGRFGADVLILDDGFQYRGVRKDIELLLLDHRRPFGNGFLFPRGPLREPPGAAARADAIIWTHYSGGAGPGLKERRLRPVAMHAFSTRPVCRLEHILTPDAHIRICPNHSLKGAKTVAFAGIAVNDGFFRDLADSGALVVQTHSFADHHAYRRRDLHAIRASLERTGAGWLATTAKDFVRLPADLLWPVPVAVYDVSPRFIGGDGPFFRFIDERLRQWRWKKSSGA